MPQQQAPPPSAGEPFAVGDAFDALVTKLGGWIEAAILGLPNFLVAVVIVAVAALFARGAKRLVHGLFNRVGDRIESTRRVANLLGTLAYVAVLAAGTFIALGILNLNGVVTSLLAGAGIVGLALGFAFQDIASNFIAGVFLAVRAPFEPGQLIETNDFLGIVHAVNLRSTELNTLQGQRVIIPNSAVFQNPLTNYATTAHRRVDIACGVGYGDDLQKAERVATEAVSALSLRSAERDVELFYNEFGDSSINFTLRFWIGETGQAAFLRAQSEAMKAIKTAFDREGVTIPFPIRTLDFDPNGGLALTDALKPALGARSDGEA
ncbi:MAG: mechanosensitive ion channel family protein [Rubricoccaceae bacterium]|nr:mechanosensitive ion channel family protein [Rubricoccaceae bacterium]